MTRNGITILNKSKIKYKIDHFIRFAVILFIFAVQGCNAPRLNPFDPENPGYDFATLQGTVQTYSLPYQNLSGVTVIWYPSNTIISTDANGYFRISNIKAADGKLIFQKNGYLSDTVNVVWNNSKALSYQVNLYSIPQLDSISIYTEVINQYTPPGQSFRLFINAKVTAKDNDIDTVFVENTQLNLRKALGYDVSNKIYESTLSMSDLNISDIEQTIGMDFNIVARDAFNREYTVGSSKITRVIKTGVTIQQPANDTTISTKPLFTWQRYSTGYTFKYMIEIYANDFSNSPAVLSVPGISSDSISYQLPSSLSSGNYYWVIWVIDQFQNRSKSLPATFTVK